MLHLCWKLKSKKNIFCVFNLILFIGYFTLLTANSFSETTSLNDTFRTTQHVSAKKGVSDNFSQFLFEENENESKDAIELQVFSIPFLNPRLDFYSNHLFDSYICPLPSKVTNPIYIEVCNFRI
jgi:hypothetical protein